jgi:hypothetical protein
VVRYLEEDGRGGWAEWGGKGGERRERGEGGGAAAAVTTQESRCVNFAKNLKLFVCFGVLSIFEPNC